MSKLTHTSIGQWRYSTQHQHFNVGRVPLLVNGDNGGWTGTDRVNLFNATNFFYLASPVPRILFHTTGTHKHTQKRLNAHDKLLKYLYKLNIIFQRHTYVTISLLTRNPSVSPSKICKRLHFSLLCLGSLHTLQVCSFRGFNSGPLPSPASLHFVRCLPLRRGTSGGSTTKSASSSKDGLSTTAQSSSQVMSIAHKPVCIVTSFPHSFIPHFYVIVG